MQAVVPFWRNALSNNDLYFGLSALTQGHPALLSEAEAVPAVAPVNGSMRSRRLILLKKPFPVRSAVG